MKFEELIEKIENDTLAIDDTAEFNYWISYHRIIKKSDNKYMYYMYEGGWSTNKEWPKETVLKQLAKLKPENVRNFCVANTAGMVLIGH